jgi:hypothetical protein
MSRSTPRGQAHCLGNGRLRLAMRRAPPNFSEAARGIDRLILRLRFRFYRLTVISSLARADARAPAAESYGCSRLSGAKERAMPDFCCKMLNEHGAMVSSADITAPNLEAAITHASALLHTSNQSAPSRRVYSFEVWSGMGRLFPRSRNLP